MEDPTQQNIPPLLPQVPRSLFDELSHFVQQLPAWAFALISLIGIFMVYQGFGGVVTFLLFGSSVTASNVDAVRWATMLGQVFFLLVPTLVLAKLRFPNTKNVFRFGAFNPTQILLVVLAVFSLQQLLQGYMMMQEALPVHFPPFIQQFIDQVKQMMEQMYGMLTSAHSFSEFLVVVLVIALTPAVCEELLFRGLIQRTLEDEGQTINASPEVKNRKAFTAAVVAGIVFGLYHLNPFAAIPLIALGIYFGFVVYSTRNIVTAIVAHFINNFVACLALYLNLGEDFIAISPTETPDAGMLAANFVLSAVVFVFTTYYLVRVTRRSTTS